MTTVQQSIDVKVPVHTVYNQLAQFEDYPRFMEEVENVMQVDETHLHWTTMMSNRTVEWDAEITEQEPDRCIAWHNDGGPIKAGKVELQELSDDAARITFTLQAESQQVPGSSPASIEQDLARRLELDLARLKVFIETQGERASPGNPPAQAAGYAAGSEGWSGDEDASAPVVSASSVKQDAKPARRLTFRAGFFLARPDSHITHALRGI